MQPFLWLVLFALLAVAHLLLHPQARVYREALRWLGQHPAPFLWLLATLMVHEAWSLRAGLATPTAEVSSLSPWPEVFVDCAARGWQRFAMLFHQGVAPPPFFPGTWPGAVLMGLISATGQMWVCCYFVASRKLLAHDGAFRQTVQRWRTILALAVCHAPWWWMYESREPATAFAGDWLMPEFLIFLAPVPLAAAAGRKDFLEAGTLAVGWWRQGWAQMLLFALTAVPLLVLLEYALQVLPEMLPPTRMVSRVLLSSALSASLHCWLFVSGALLLLRGGYLEGKLDQKPPDV